MGIITSVNPVASNIIINSTKSITSTATDLSSPIKTIPNGVASRRIKNSSTTPEDILSKTEEILGKGKLKSLLVGMHPMGTSAGSAANEMRQIASITSQA